MSLLFLFYNGQYEQRNEIIKHDTCNGCALTGPVQEIPAEINGGETITVNLCIECLQHLHDELEDYDGERLVCKANGDTE